MRAVVQRCISSSVTVDNEIISDISFGLLVLLGVHKGDKKKDSEYIAKKITSLRIFNDKEGKMNLSINDVKGSILVVSQFTLCANLKRGSRPSFIEAAPPEIGETLYNYLVSYLRKNVAGPSLMSSTFICSPNLPVCTSATFVIDSNE